MRYFNVPADFKKETIDKYVQYNQQYENAKVVETYGNINKGNWIRTSGRAAGYLPEADMDSLSDYITYSEKNDIRFNYTLNAIHLMNREYTDKGIADIKRLLHSLYEIGVRTVIVALPLLFEVIKSTGLDFKIKGSTICGVDTPNKAKMFKNWGVDKIVPAESANRNFAALERILEIFDGEVEVMTNNYCHNECLWRQFHYAQISFIVDDEEMPAANSFFPNRCIARLFDDPLNSLQRMWIRPEDLHYYEDIGIKYFKLAGRQLISMRVKKRENLSGDIASTVKYYMEGRYDGDLNDLIYLFNPAYDSIRVPLNNRQLDGFLVPFAKKGKICQHDCEKCGYCFEWAKRAINLDQLKKQREMIQKFYALFDDAKKMIWKNNANFPKKKFPY